jgi:signal transduction histidine kinase
VTAPLRLLHLEDSPNDAELIRETLAGGGIACHATRVDTRAAFLAALKQGGYDLILADYSLPTFDGIAALTLAHDLRPEVPFIFVSATLGEELAIDAMHRGATDYILKQRLGRLVPSVQRALRELEGREERKRAEDALRQSELQLRQSQKMEAVGRLAGGLAHDFNNLLTVIMGYSQVLHGELGKDHPLRGKIEETLRAGERAATLIRQLLAFSRRQPIEVKVLTLNSVVTGLESMLRRLIGEDIVLRIHPDPTDGRVKADPGQLEQVVMNLVVNARDAMPKGGTLTIDVERCELTRTPQYHLQPLPLGHYMKLSVTDTGCGMDQETLSRIFEPFFTTKEEGRGTGLGLSTVFGIVTRGEGGIDVSSSLGRGSRFDVYLPEVQSEAEVAKPSGPGQPVSRGSETILVVEDEPTVRLLVRDELKKLGYRVIEAKNGIEACLLATQHVGQLHLLLTDVVMPGMNGRELALHVNTIKPGLKILFISGYLDDVGLEAGLNADRTGFLQKPFTPDQLARSVREVLDTATVRKPAVSASGTAT